MGDKFGTVAQELSGAGDVEQHGHPAPDAQPGDAQECHPARLWHMGSASDGAVHREPGDPRLRPAPLDGAGRTEDPEPAADDERDATKLPEGLNYTVSWGGTKTTSNSTFNQLQPGAFGQPGDRVLAAVTARTAERTSTG